MRARKAKKHLKKLSGRDFQAGRELLHLQGARRPRERHLPAIALEDPKDIRERRTVRRGQRTKFSKQTYFEPRKFIKYKAKLNYLPAFPVDLRNTSRERPFYTTQTRGTGHLGMCSGIYRAATPL